MKQETKQRVEGLKMLVNMLTTNSVTSQRDQLFRGDGYGLGQDPKHHCLYDEFGYKRTLTYEDFRNLYERQGIAGGGIDKIAKKAFETMPELVEGEESNKNTDETAAEKEFRLFEKRLGLFNIYMDCTIRRSVGNYSAMILQIADGKTWDQKAENIRPEQIIKVIPVWEHQLYVGNFDQDQQSPTYGEPVNFTYNEYDFNRSNTQNAGPQRSVTIDASRVIWFGDLYSNGSEPLLGNLMLKKGYNDWITLEKVIGSGGEGAYKNAARHIATSFDRETNIGDIMKMFGVTDAGELGDVLQAMTSDLNSNFDAGIFGKGASYDVLSTSLPDMRDTFDNPLMSAASSIDVPASILAMKLTGERASTQDEKAFAKSTTSYRNLVLQPEILRNMMQKFEILGMWAGIEWSVDWDSLLDASEEEKTNIAETMARTNQLSVASTGEPVYAQKEIRVAGGQEPEMEMTDAQKRIVEQGENMDQLPEE